MKTPSATFTAGILLVCALAQGASATATPSSRAFPPDIVVAADGSGDFATIQAALASIAPDNRERRIVFVKDGVYAEKVRVDAACITLRGESRKDTRIEFAQGAEEFRQSPDDLGIGVVNLGVGANDFVLENLTVRNTHGVIGRHAFAVFGAGDRTVIIDCDVLSQGNDTLSLWRTAQRAADLKLEPGINANGRYYHARLEVCGSVDFICPRGWCYMRDSKIREVNPGAEAAIWHDGSRDRDMKFVLRNCRFEGVPGWRFARWHHDAQFFLIDCSFSQEMRDRPPRRVIYPLKGGEPTTADIARNKELDATNIWGDRVYFDNCHRDGGDYAWHGDNLATAPGAPKPEAITAVWTFAGTWDPERTDPPRVTGVTRKDGAFVVEFSESVTVKGAPALVLRDGVFVPYASGSGSSTVAFAPARGTGSAEDALRLDLARGTILASEAGATLRVAEPALP